METLCKCSEQYSDRGVLVVTYQNASEYLDAVRSCIRWKRAKIPATREISDHIEDLVDEYTSKGITKEFAVQKALAEMGDATLIGKELDRVYRPKTNWLLIGIVSLTLVSGAVSGILSGGTWTSGRIFAVICGGILAAVLYFSDFIRWLRMPYRVYGILSVITALVFWYDARNGTEWITNGYTGYALMWYPVALCGIVWQGGKIEKPMALHRFMLLSLWPLLCSIALKSAGTMAVLGISIALIAWFGIQQGWIAIERRKKTGLVWVAILVVLSICSYFLIRERIGLADTGYLQSSLQTAVGDISIVGKSSASFPQSVDFPFLMIALSCGWAALAVVIGMCFLLLCVLHRCGKRQPAAIAQLLCMTVFVVFAAQFAVTLVGDVGLMPHFSMSIPFVSGGGAYTVVNFTLIGIVLCVCRNENISKELTATTRENKPANFS